MAAPKECVTIDARELAALESVAKAAARFWSSQAADGFIPCDTDYCSHGCRHIRAMNRGQDRLRKLRAQPAGRR